MHSIPSWIALLLFAAAPTDTQVSDVAASQACIACRASVESLRGAISEQDWARVERREIITRKVDGEVSDGGKTSAVQSAMIVPQSPRDVWAVLVDFESRPKFVPTAKKIEITRRAGNEVWVDEHLKVVFMSIYFRTINTLEPEVGRVQWRIDREVKNDIADTTGSWQIAAIDDDHTLIFYQAHIESGQPVPGFIEDALSKRSLPKMMSGLRKVLADRFPPKPVIKNAPAHTS